MNARLFCTVYLSCEAVCECFPALKANLYTLYSMPGYARLQLLDKGDSAIAFVKFMDVAHAANAHKALQEIFLPSSAQCSSGILVDFVKTEGYEVN